MLWTFCSSVRTNESSILTQCVPKMYLGPGQETMITSYENELLFRQQTIQFKICYGCTGRFLSNNSQKLDFYIRFVCEKTLYDSY